MKKQLKIGPKALKAGLKVFYQLFKEWDFGRKRRFPPDLIKTAVILFVFSLVIGNSYLSSKTRVIQSGGIEPDNIIEENGLISAGVKENFLSQTAFAYSDSLTADGSVLSLENNQHFSPAAESFFIIVDNSSLIGANAPLAFYLPTVKRHGVLNYEVKSGDTAGKIAANFGVSLNTILWANNLKSGSLLKPGQDLVILPISGVRHFVKQGDTVSSLAKKYQVSTEEIIAFNNLSKETGITIGQELIIPGGQLSSGASSLAANTGLRPMAIDVFGWQSLKEFFTYPTSGGWNTGILHDYNAVDITNSCGSPIYASAEGMVVEAKTGWNGGYGNYVKIQHFNAVLTLYAHLSDIYVKQGDRVSQKQIIAIMSDTGKTTGCHLHFEVRGAETPFVLKK